MPAHKPVAVGPICKGLTLHVYDGPHKQVVFTVMLPSHELHDEGGMAVNVTSGRMTCVRNDAPLASVTVRHIGTHGCILDRLIHGALLPLHHKYEYGGTPPTTLAHCISPQLPVPINTVMNDDGARITFKAAVHPLPSVTVTVYVPCPRPLRF